MKKVYSERAKTVRNCRIMPALTAYEFDALYELRRLYGTESINEVTGRAIREAYDRRCGAQVQTGRGKS